MAKNNVYGIKKPSVINIDRDVDIYYNYREKRTSNNEGSGVFKKINNVSSVLSHATLEETDSGFETILHGMYTLKLPVTTFGEVGIYTIYIVPKQIHCRISDVGVLDAYNDIRGIVVDVNGVSTDGNLFRDDNLTGYRVDYYDYVSGVLKKQETFRIITSSNLCEPTTQNAINGGNQNTSYRFTNSGSLCFMTLTPSTAPSFKANSKPYIGVPNQNITITNTKFDPICIEVSVVEHDIETVSTMLEGEQMRNLENGRLTTYNSDGEVYKQFEFSTIKDNYTGASIAELKLDKTGNIDMSIDINDLK